MSERRRRSPIWAILLLVALAVTLAGIFPFRQIIAQQRQVDATEAKLAALEEENARLDELAAALETDLEVERLARERFGLVRPGEVGYVVQWEPAPAVVEAPPLPPGDDRAWYERVWDFVTGRDFDGGG